jgi:chromosome partitioning protein
MTDLITTYSVDANATLDIGASAERIDDVGNATAEVPRQDRSDERPARFSRRIAIANQKGGVGKTTTAVNLSAALARQGHRTLLIDVDPQANASSGVGLEKGAPGLSSYDLLSGVDLEQVIRSTSVPNLDLVASSPALSGAEVELVDAPNRESILREQLEKVADRYEYIFIDCPPSLGLLTLNALVAADSVLIPLQCEYYALEGLSHLLETLSRVQQGLNPKLEVEGVLLTMFDSRLNLSTQVAEEARRHFGPRVYETMIPRNVRLGEAPSFGKPITEYDPHCVGATSYIHLAKEIVANVR